MYMVLRGIGWVVHCVGGMMWRRGGEWQIFDDCASKDTYPSKSGCGGKVQNGCVNFLWLVVLTADSRHRKRFR
jgi:hypothetical protein